MVLNEILVYTFTIMNKKIKNALIIAGVIIAAGILFAVLNSNNMNTGKEKNDYYTSISYPEFLEKSKIDNTVVIDIRTTEETNAATLFPDVLTDFDYYESDFEQKISELDKDKTYLIYCRSGSRTGKSLKIFEKYGLTAYHLDGGHKSTPAGSLK